MYLHHFGLQTLPFRRTPDPRFFHRTPMHDEALERLLFAVEEQDHAVLTGDIGTGKTVIARTLIDLLDPTRYSVALIVNPIMTPAQFLRVIAEELEHPCTQRSKSDLINHIGDVLVELETLNRYPVVIIDEAHLISSKQVFDEIRLITNLQRDDANRVSFIFIGQPELLSRLKRKAYTALRQRIGISCELAPLSTEDVRDYLRHRLVVAGASSSVFSEDAVASIRERSRGIPRLINGLAHFALLTAFSGGHAIVHAGMVEEAARDFMSLQLAE